MAKKSKAKEKKKRQRQLLNIAADLSEMSSEDIMQMYRARRQQESYNVMVNHFFDTDKGKGIALHKDKNVAAQIQFVGIAKLELAATLCRSGHYPVPIALIMAGVGPHPLDDALMLKLSGFGLPEAPTPASAGWLAWSVLGDQMIMRLGKDFAYGWEKQVILRDILVAAQEWRKRVEIPVAATADDTLDETAGEKVQSYE